ncbi:dihydrofolate reductase [Ktedonosporobacter rubrisoli]|uniref:Dihydrofolate reductase n=1 Tax=Ktedonosporobacter rubrisoli TaxID=2509675 RepID=A0A4V0YYM3_KTERU|nr:dihydrofolate reductase [Ktedonosporobacter rubrisoli]QBD76721.1 dihydrofolate reductase [Ktedonosporobacter rubrisoli]
MISLIAAYAHGRVIGKQGTIPWHLPDDMQYFKRTTSGHTIVMGYTTFASLGRPLPKRRNVVLTRRHTLEQPGIEVAHSIEDVLSLGDVFIIGGEEVYRQFLPLADRLYITEIELDVEGDRFFPAWDQQSFTLRASQEGLVDEKNPFPHTFFVYERKRPS